MEKLLPLKIFLRAVPDSFHSRLFSRVCTQLMRGQSIRKKLKKLEDKLIRITITDTGNSWCFRFLSSGLQAVELHNAKADVHIKGSLNTFLLLALHNEDPDTLFFNQELSLEGNTADGLFLRNSLDAMEFNTQAHLQAVLGDSVADVFAPVIKRFKIASRLQQLGKSLI